VRDLAFETGFMGEPAGWYWRDACSFAELWTSYYTDVEPESTWVADGGGIVLGYLTGCVGSRRAPSPRSAITRQLFRRGLLVRPGTAGFFWRSTADTARHPNVPSGEITDARRRTCTRICTARGAWAVEAWLDQLRALGSPGCPLGTLAENTNALALFERMGFARRGPAAARCASADCLGLLAAARS
jgi:hypothetical protein